MVKAKSAPKGNWLTDALNRIDKDHPVVAERWFIREITPSRRYSYDNGHGQAEYDWTSPTAVKVSPYFDTKKEALGWMDEHEPDEGTTLKIYHDECRRYIHDRWSSESRF